MSFAAMGLAGIAVCWKWGDWRNWRLYYPTILYLMVGNLVCDYLLHGRQMWGFGKFIDAYPVLSLAVMLLLYPATVILYLTFLPKPAGRQALYVLLWVGIYTAIEMLAYLTGGFCYHSCWNIWLSLAFNAIMFPLLLLHYKKPLLVWPLSAAICFLFLWWFGIPLAR